MRPLREDARLQKVVIDILLALEMFPQLVSAELEVEGLDHLRCPDRWLISFTVRYETAPAP